MTEVKWVKTTGEDLFYLSCILGVEKHPDLNEENAKKIENFDHTYSLVDVFGKVWAIAGIMEYAPGIYEAWMLVDPAAGSYMIRMTRAFKDYFGSHPAKAIEAWVKVGFDKGHRYMDMLGFKLQAPDTSRDREGLNYARYLLLKKDGS